MEPVPQIGTLPDVHCRGAIVHADHIGRRKVKRREGGSTFPKPVSAGAVDLMATRRGDCPPDPVNLSRSPAHSRSALGEKGFTLIELIIAITIAGILAALALPSFQRTIRSNRGVTDANSMLSLTTLARSTAIERDGYTVLCINTSSTTPACSTTAGATWDQGILLFIDANNNGTYESATDTLIRNEVPFSSSSTITYSTASSSTALTALSFNGQGQLNTANGAGHFDVKPANTTTGERYVVVKQIGRVAVCTPTDTSCGP
jgi:type IV fimbrial biogenesis protein FimT